MRSRAQTDEAHAFLRDAYGRRLRRPGRTPEHAIAVARLLVDIGQPEPVIVAGLLHDVLEDTEVSRAELRQQFGDEVADLVEALTEDSSIRAHRRRKAALLEQVLDAGPVAATIALADKAAKLDGRDGPPSERRLEHHRATLEGIERRYGHSKLSELLRRRLAPYEGVALSVQTAD